MSRNASFEGFKAGIILFREEFTSRNWANDYNFSPPFWMDRVKQDDGVADETPSAGQAWFFNHAPWAKIRRPAGAPGDRTFCSISSGRMRTSMFRLLRALDVILRDDRTQGRRAFPDRVIKKKNAELALLEPFRADLPAAVFRRTPTCRR